MKIKYFEDTDTLYIQFRDVEVAEARDLDEDTLLELDHKGLICAITLEHARVRADIPRFSFENVAGQESEDDTMKKMPKFDAAEFLDNEEVIAEYLNAALEDENPDVFLVAVSDVAKAYAVPVHK